MHRKGFSLTEVVIAIGVIATALTALVALIPSALDGRSQSKTHTVLSVILEDVKERVEGNELDRANESLPMSPLFYDAQGVLLAGEEESNRRRYRVDVRLVVPHAENTPAHTDDLRTAVVAVGWPVDSASGEVLGGARRKRIVTSFHVTTLTGRDWTEVDPRYKPKIEY